MARQVTDIYDARDKLKNLLTVGTNTMVLMVLNCTFPQHIDLINIIQCGFQKTISACG